MLRGNLLNDIANLSIEKDDSDDFSSDCEDNYEDDFCEWDVKSGLYEVCPKSNVSDLK